MPRFDLRVEFERKPFHTIGTAESLQVLPAAVASALASRIIQMTGEEVDGPSAPEKEKEYAAAIAVIERSSGKLDHATKNNVRRELGLTPLKKKEEDRQIEQGQQIPKSMK